MAGYERLLPGASERILKMAEEANKAAVAAKRTDTNARAYARIVSVTGFTLLPFAYVFASIYLQDRGQWGITFFGLAAVITAGAALIGFRNPKNEP